MQGKRVGLVSHPAAVNTTATHSSEVLRAAEINFSALYGPDRGFSGAAAEGSGAIQCEEKIMRLASVTFPPIKRES